MAKKKTEKKLYLSSLLGLVAILTLASYAVLGIDQKKVETTPEIEDLGVILPPPAAYPKNLSKSLPPLLTATSYRAVDVDSGVILLEKDAFIATSPASTTKIMTALLTLEAYKLDQVLEVNGLNEIEGQKMNLVNGEKITVRNLLYGLMVASANDAALVLAKNFPGGESGFIWAMNQKAAELKLKQTHFTNPVGYDDLGHLASAADLTRLAIEAMQKPDFARIVGTQEITVSDIEGKIFHRFSNVNTLLGKIPGIKGVKTGWTSAAGECLVSFFERDNHRVVISLFGSRDRFGETKILAEWIFANFIWEDFAP